MIAPHTSLHDELEIFLGFRDLVSQNPCAVEFNSEVLAELLYREHLLSFVPAPLGVEAAREALLTDDELLA